MEKLRAEVCKANKKLLEKGLVLYSWGNVSAIDRKRGIIAIKPSGVSFKSIKPSDIVLLDIDGNLVEGSRRPSSDLPTHVEIYRRFPLVGAVVHTHSSHATAFAQAKSPIDCLGTTHADHFYGSIPVTRDLSPDEVKEGYEANTGKVICEHFSKNNLDPGSMPACLVASHGPFAWGKNLSEALYHAVCLEEIAKIKLNTLRINPEVKSIQGYILDKHYDRKHGKDAYYGQPKADR